MCLHCPIKRQMFATSKQIMITNCISEYNFSDVERLTILLKLLKIFKSQVDANSADRDQTAPRGAV